MDAAVDPGPPRRGGVVVLAALVALQGAALVAGAGFYFRELARGAVNDRTGSAVAAVIALIFAAGLLAAARGLYRRRRWARAPALVVQLILLLVALGPDGLISGGAPYAGGLLVLWALVVTGLLFAPSVGRLLEE